MTTTTPVKSRMEAEPIQPQTPMSPLELDQQKELEEDHIIIQLKDLDIPSPHPHHSSKRGTVLSIDAATMPSQTTFKDACSIKALSLPDLRANFIKKVLGILCLQLATTGLIVGLTFVPSLGIRTFMAGDYIVLLLATALCICCLIVFACNRQNFRRVPRNYILLTTFTLSISYILGSIASITQSEVVLFAGIGTLIIVFGITAYALKTKGDMTRRGIAFSALFTTLLLILVCGLAFSARIAAIIYSAIIGLAFGIHLAYSIQRLTGKYEEEYSLDDYVVASLEIYIDIIQIFMTILELARRLASH